MELTRILALGGALIFGGTCVVASLDKELDTMTKAALWLAAITVVLVVLSKW